MYRLSKEYRIIAESNRVEYIWRETRRMEAQSNRNVEEIVKSPNKYRETEGSNGDMDGDAFITTDNPILLRNTLNSPTIVCVQRKAAKEIITEEALAKSNTQSFGSDIGAITNRVTSMYEVIAQFDKESIEYKTLDYRMKCGQLAQQNSIDG